MSLKYKFIANPKNQSVKGNSHTKTSNTNQKNKKEKKKKMIKKVSSCFLEDTRCVAR